MNEKRKNEFYFFSTGFSVFSSVIKKKRENVERKKIAKDLQDLVFVVRYFRFFFRKNQEKRVLMSEMKIPH